MAQRARHSRIPRSVFALGCLLCCAISGAVPLQLHYWTGIRDAATKSDGVTFRVEIIEPGQPAIALADKHCAGRGWQAFAVDLSAYRGKEVVIRFSTAPGATTTDDWACWGEPRIVEGEDVLLDFTKAKIWRSGIVVAGKERTPMDQTNTGATFLTGSNSCGKEKKAGFFAHPPWRGDAAGGIAFAEFKVVVGTATATATKRPPLPIEFPEQSPFPWGIAPCFKVQTAITIDGDLADWPERVANAFLSIQDKEQMCVEVCSYKPGFKAGWTGLRDLSAGVYVAWDDSNLYLAQIRRDDVLQFMDTMSQDFSRSDSVRVCISRDPTATTLTENDLVLAINPEGEMGQAMVRICSYGGYRHANVPVDRVAVAPVLYSNGYVMEMRIPFAVLGIVPEPGLTLGFQVIIDDSDTPMDRHYEMLWRPKAAPDYGQNPSSFGKLTLCSSAFAWLTLPRQVYAVGEAPQLDLGLYATAQKPEARLGGTLFDADGRATSKLLEEELSHGSPLSLPQLTGEGRHRFEYALRTGEDTTSGTLELTAIRDRDQRNLLRLGPAKDAALLPSIGPEHYANRGVEQGDGFLFEYLGPDCRITYTCRPAPGFDISVHCDGRQIYRTDADETGPVIAVGGKPVPLGKCEATISDVELDAHVLSYTCRIPDVGTVAYRLQIKGKTLVVDVESEQTRFQEFRGPLHGMKAVEPFIPYLERRMGARLLENCYVSSYTDWTMTGSSSLGPLGLTRYDSKTDGTRNALRERTYVTVSPELLEVLPNLPNPPSPFMEQLSTKVVFDWWSWGGGFEGGARYLEALKGYGVDEMAIIYHVWQKHGYDNGLPEHVPAMESMGGDAGMRILGATAKRLGYLFSLHENYIDYYPNYPDYTEDGVALNPRGEKYEAWYMPSTGMQSYRLKPSWIERYVRDQSTKVHDWYQTSASYLDVHSVNLPWQLDFDAKAEGAASFRYTFEKTTWLFNFMRETHAGPLFGEGNMHAVWAGRIDGCEAQIGGRAGEISPVLVDYDLLKVHPLTVNHGMGYYSRWHRKRAGRLKDEEMDKYRAQELAYGHAGFLNTGMFPNLTQVLREYYLVQPLQARYVLARPLTIEYLFGDRWVSSRVACRTDAARKVHVVYDNGLELWVNDKRPGWSVYGKNMPPYGFVAKGAGVTAWTALLPDGSIADYAQTADRIFADPRGYETHYSGTSSRIKVGPLPAVLKSLSARTVEVTYQWVVDQRPAKDYVVFVHFTDAQGTICWQGDHRPTPRTNAWSVGTTIADGPFTVEIPDSIGPGVYDIRVGMFRPGEGRLALTGNDDGQSRHTVGRIEIKAETTAIGFLPPPTASGSLTPGRNPEGTVVDFGTLATTITVRIDRADSALRVMPIPHGRDGAITLRMDQLNPGKSVKDNGVAALDSNGEILATIPFTRKGMEITFLATVGDAWSYRVELEDSKRSKAE